MTEDAFAAAAAALESGRPAAAEEICADALAANPHDVSWLSLRAAIAIRTNRAADAEVALRRALALDQTIAGTHEGLAEALMLQGRFAEAEAALLDARRLAPQRPSVHVKLAHVRARLGRGEESRRSLEDFQRLAPEHGVLARAAAARRAGRHDAAERDYRELLSANPDSLDASLGLGEVLFETARYEDSIKAFREATRLAPDLVQPWVDLAKAQHQAQQIDAAIASLQKAVALDPPRPEVFTLLGSLLAMSDREHAALEAFEAALRRDPTHAPTFENMGHALKTIGRYDDAVAAYRSCIRHKPDAGQAYWSLANLKTFRFDDTDIAAMEAQIARPEVDDRSRVPVLFALGKAYEDKQEYDRCFDHYDRGNRLQRRFESYDGAALRRQHDAVIETFTEELLARTAARASAAPTPIFIVGLPRSGSTLIEQILASHSQVEGTHELAELLRTVKWLDQQSGDARYPGSLQAMSHEGLAAAGAYYLERTQRHRGDKPFFTDKMPNNFALVGLIHLILPHAKIIDARRDAMDTCWSCYKQLFARGQPFTYDLAELGEYYADYRRIMAHWDCVLPGKVLRVDYEGVVADLEREVRRILGFCGLPFEAACLRFHETERSVKTASSQQVRQPIYDASVGSWRRVAANLGALGRALS